MNVSLQTDLGLVGEDGVTELLRAAGPDGIGGGGEGCAVGGAPGDFSGEVTL